MILSIFSSARGCDTLLLRLYTLSQSGYCLVQAGSLLHTNTKKRLREQAVYRFLSSFQELGCEGGRFLDQSMIKVVDAMLLAGLRYSFHDFMNHVLLQFRIEYYTFDQWTICGIPRTNMHDHNWLLSELE